VDTFFSNIHSDDQGFLNNAVSRFISGEQQEYDIVMRMRHKDGGYRWIRAIGEAFRDKDGVAMRIAGSHIDITDLKQTELELQKTSDRLMQLAEQSRNIAWETDDKGSFTYVSQVAKSVLGYEPCELTGRMHFYDLHPEQDREEFKKAALDVYKTFQPFEGLPNQLVTKQGNVIWVSTNGIPILREDGSLQGYRGSDTDITKRVELEESVKELNRQIRESLEEQVEKKTEELRAAMAELLEREKMASLGSLVSGIAHEINTPLGIGVTTASYLDKINNEARELLAEGKMSKEGLLHFMESVNESITILNSNLYRASELIKNFKQIAVNQSNELRTRFKILDYIHSLLVSLKHEYKSKDIKFEIDCPEDLMFNSYPGIISQILTNLVMNSLVHGFKGRESGRIKITVRMDEENIYLIYEDDGRGISPENLPRIQDPFFTTNREHGGSGLGMNIIYNLVTSKLGGTMQSESEFGSYTKFTIQFPIERGEN
jgi:PAS domain S-box-containing protein